MQVIGISLNLLEIRSAILKDNEDFLCEMEEWSPTTFGRKGSEILEAIKNSIRRLISKAGNVDGICVAWDGVVRDNAIPIDCLIVRNIEEDDFARNITPLADILSRNFNLPVKVIKESEAIAIHENIMKGGVRQPEIVPPYNPSLVPFAEISKEMIESNFRQKIVPLTQRSFAGYRGKEPVSIITSVIKGEISLPITARTIFVTGYNHVGALLDEKSSLRWILGAFDNLIIDSNPNAPVNPITGIPGQMGYYLSSLGICWAAEACGYSNIPNDEIMKYSDPDDRAIIKILTELGNYIAAAVGVMAFTIPEANTVIFSGDIFRCEAAPFMIKKAQEIYSKDYVKNLGARPMHIDLLIDDYAAAKGAAYHFFLQNSDHDNIRSRFPTAKMDRCRDLDAIFITGLNSLPTQDDVVRILSSDIELKSMRGRAPIYVCLSSLVYPEIKNYSDEGRAIMAMKNAIKAESLKILNFPVDLDDFDFVAIGEFPPELLMAKVSSKKKEDYYP